MYYTTDYQPHSISELTSMNSDCFGWISIKGTNINYPVMHTPDNPQMYLNRNFYCEYSFSGVPFLDGRCSADSTNLIIYGHHMNNGTMFPTFATIQALHTEMNTKQLCLKQKTVYLHIPSLLF